MVKKREDQDLVERLLDGDERAFNDFFEAHFQRLFRFSLARLDNDVEATREVVQNALMKAIDKLETFRGDASLYTWLCSICRYEILDHHREKRHRKIDLIEDDPRVRAALMTLEASIDDHPETALRQKEVGRLVHATLDHLPARYGSALEMRYLEGHSVEEIASRLEIGYKATESLLSRARVAFRKGFSAVAAAAAPLQPNPEGAHHVSPP